MEVLNKCLLIWVLFLNIKAELDGPVVQTSLGGVRGQYVEVKGKETLVHAYLGVPFAKPPVGPLRLAPPQPAERWEGLRDATQQPFMCVQDRQISLDLARNVSLKIEVPEVSEDCLYLNIYTPATASENTKLPVMFWIHGGGFSVGSASMYDGSTLAAYQDVVVVLVQYRLGMLGFISTGDQHLPGNVGLMDQVEGLRWVQQHIHNFGGDPDSVTIFGESAGGVSVSLLLLSPLSSGLFHGAIAESGTAGMDSLLSPDPLSLAQMVANISGCDSSSTEKISDCVMQLSVDAILTFQKDAILTFQKEKQMLFFGVVVDGQYLPKSVDTIFQNHEMHKVPIVVGVNNDEGGWLLSRFLAPPGWEDGMDREQVMPVFGWLYPNSKEEWITELIANEYLGTTGDRLKIRHGYTQLIGDLIFTIPVIKTANAHRDAGAAVYLYELQEPPSVLRKIRPSFVGVDHGDDVFYVFGFCLTQSHMDGRCSEDDEQLSVTIMKYWGNFAHTGNPNGAGLAQWPQYGAEGDYLGIGLEQVPGQNLKRERFNFMTQTLPEKIRQARKKIPETGPVVHTSLGGVRGQYVEVKGKETLVHAYLGVPFAKPPVGPLRLAPPQPAERWEGLRDATQQPFMCVQDRQISFDLAGNLSLKVEVPEVSEDCLYLNIYTPATASENTKLPVMFWIHGGGFSVGSASMYDGSTLAAYQDVVVVLVQYRLGMLGFISTGDQNLPGNVGLMDQVEGLRWVQQHIHNFGGDPDSVTIFGESAGGVSVSLLLLSPLSSGLFHGAIAESGTAGMEALLSPDPLSLAQMVANISGCDSSSTEKISDCVMQLSVDAILTFQKEKQMLFFGVVVDGQYLPKSVDTIFQNHEMHKVPIVVGVNNDEGGWLLSRFLAPPGWEDGMDREQVMPVFGWLYPNSKEEWITELIANEYLGTTGDRLKIRHGYTQLIGDLIFTIPVIKTANAHRDAGAAVYLYELQEPPSVLRKMRPSFVGVDHGDEILYVFGFCLMQSHMDGRCSEDDEQLSVTIMKYWGNFAHTGNPNGAGLAQWPQYGAEGDYLGIGLEQVPGQNLKRERFNFMTQTLPEKIRQARKKIPETGPVVHTSLGGVRGQYVEVKGKETLVHAYLGVPFAKPPVGPLRLAPPQPAERWEGLRDATQQPFMCVQDRQISFDLAGNLSLKVEVPEVSEDCLYLNIYTPATASENTKLPVMFWIHGGGFSVGSASMYDGSTLAAYQDVVVVLVQYRLGMLGFISTGDQNLPGNVGLMDQVEGLRWVQQHIHNFGGDPDSVTIFGESAGGVSVSLLLLSPLSSGLFHGAIAESGTAGMEALLSPDPLPIAQMVANISGCDSSSTEKISDCVMQLSVDAILTFQKENPMFYGVVVDGQYLPKSVAAIFQNHEMHKVPVVVGVNNDEGGWLLSRLFAPPGWEEDGMDREQVIPVLGLLYPNSKEEWITELIANEYLGTTGDRLKIRHGYTQLIGDLMFTIPIIKTANAHRDAGAAVYLYELQEPPSVLRKIRPSFVGVDHGDDILYVFGFCLTQSHMDGRCSEDDEQLSVTIMKYWGNFAHTGNPNGAGLAQWPQYGAEGDYLGIGLEQVPGQNLKRERFNFMTQTLPEKIRQTREKMKHSEL